MKIANTKRRITRRSTQNDTYHVPYLFKQLSIFDKPKPSEKRIATMTKRERHRYLVGEFTVYGSSITFDLPNGLPGDWETDGIDTVLDILDAYKLDTSVGWDINWKETKQFTIKVYDQNERNKLSESFVNLVGNTLNNRVFKGTIKSIKVNFDGMWED